MNTLTTPGRIALCLTAGLTLGALTGVGHAMTSDHPWTLSVPVFALVVGLPLAAVLHPILWPSQQLQRDQRTMEHSIEKEWFTQASALAFWWLAACLLVMAGFGEALGLSWLSPLGIWHVLGAAVLSYAGCYWAARTGRI